MAWPLLFSTLAVVAAVSLGACSPDLPADPSKTQAMAVDSARPSVSGAWGAIDAFSPDVQEAARFAVQTFAVQNKQRVLFKDVTQARQQVVAGLNFELHLSVTLDGIPRTVQAKVTRQLNGVYSLNSWDWLD
jgi:subtilisin family serine protease